MEFIQNYPVILLLIPAIVIAYFLFCVFEMKFATEQNANVQFTAYDPNISPPHKDVFQHIYDIYDKMNQCGFQIVGYLYQEGQVKRVDSYVTILHNSSKKESLYIYSVRATSTMVDLVLVTHSMEFVTQFHNGGELGTINGKIPLGIFKPWPGKHTFQFSSVNDCLELYRRHKVLSMLFRNEKRQELVETPDEAIVNLVKSSRKELEYQVTVGLMRFNSKKNIYQPSFIGAAWTVLKLHTPLRQLRRAYRTKKNETLLRKLEMEFPTES